MNFCEIKYCQKCLEVCLYCQRIRLKPTKMTKNPKKSMNDLTQKKLKYLPFPSGKSPFRMIPSYIALVETHLKLFRNNSE